MARVLIVGATSAIAIATARLYAARGDELVVAARDSQRLVQVAADLQARGASAVTQLEFSVTADTDYASFAEQAWGQGLDVVLVAHGELSAQLECQDDIAATRQQLEINGLSTIYLLTALAPRFSAQAAGSIVVISSVAGDRGRQSNYVYGTAKAAVTVFCQGLRNRLAGSGVAVITVKPGFVDTPMTAHLPKGLLWAQPEAIAAGIFKAQQRGSEVVYLPGFWRLIMLVIKLIPERLFKRLSL